ncbi:MAG TPA: TM0106 family RecB-like putative nuclease [Acidimicrobiales bacterium]|nr:TM0106 family RecB-like putative nuclease [Acidimicrobiales bacterium]
MVRPLRGDEILACPHRVALSRGEPFDFAAAPPSAEIQRRRRDAEAVRDSVIAEMLEVHVDAARPAGVDETLKHLDEGTGLIVSPHLPEDVDGRRRARVQALVRVGRVGTRYTYAPLLIKNIEVVETALTRRILEGTLDRLTPAEAQFTNGVGVRSSPSVTRTGITLAHATRVLGALGYASAAAHAGVVDRRRRVFWFDLAGRDYPRFSLAAYDEHYARRLAVIEDHARWLEEGGPFPTSAYWHRDCLDCPYASHCQSELEATDDVSLTRFTTASQQLLLREHGVTTRARLATLDPRRARSARRRVADGSLEGVLGAAIDKLDDLIYRARAHVSGGPLRIADVEEMGCPSADVEVDIDMESYGDATYLWGAVVHVADSVGERAGALTPGYRYFVNWDELDADAEAALFARFWAWFDALRTTCREAGLSLAAYCFWAQAEDGAMNRAVAAPLASGPTIEDLREFREAQPRQWVDLHALAKAQIQTEGPLGLKLLATGAGFNWRDPTPSGEASMAWYEVARGSGPVADASRQRILDYNEDDCRATKALRDWLNGPARLLAHRDEV